MGGTRCFLDIDIGDQAVYAQQLAAFKRLDAFFQQVGSQYGLQGPLNDLDEESKSMILEAYNNDPKWSSQGEASSNKPADIRAGRIVVELFDADCPKTAANFKCLCTGEKGLGKASKKPLHYQGVKFHRIVKGFCCQGGDVVRGDGSGGDSIYNGQFNDEKKGLAMKHEFGTLSMANSGKNSNTSQFFFALAAAPQCDGKHTAFGRVVEGLDILKRIDEEAASADGTPRVDVTVASCGVL